MRWITAAACALTLVTPGCALVNASKTATHEVWRSVRPKSGDSQTKSETIKDEWGFVGQTGRGGTLEPEHDPLKKWMYSPQHLEIERNLGIGD